ncbi:MAG: polysaccharide pyruvyl transferase family protein [Lachnospiraceae bacterium]|nr:polysaccharide pyruvyl transferase family protein [Lachnospiraceae bacterium]
MSKLTQTLRKCRIINYILDSLFFIKKRSRIFKQRKLINNLSNKAIERLSHMSASSHIYFCGVPVHRNMGDQAQRYCIRQWCKKNYPEFDILEIETWPFYNKKFCQQLLNTVEHDDIFVIQSGYCTTSRHFDHDMHRFIVKTFPKNRILIMPQTVNFSQKRDGVKTGKIYNEHKKLLFLARDRISYESAKQYFASTEIRLFPDIVTSLIGTMQFQTNREGVLICVRNDGEKKYSNESINELKNRIETLGVPCGISDTNSELPLDILVNNFESELQKKLSFFAKHNLVITDRYHGTIFALISNTPVIVLATNDHKVKTGTEWFTGIYDEAFHNAASIDDAFSIAQQVLKNPVHICNQAFFGQKYYSKLKDIFEGLEASGHE